MPDHDESKLPRWAQVRLDELRRKRDQLEGRIATMRQVHTLLTEHEWFTLKNPRTDTLDARPRQLWFLDRDNPFPACSLAPGDILLVGRLRKPGDST